MHRRIARTAAVGGIPRRTAAQPAPSITRLAVAISGCRSDKPPGPGAGEVGFPPFPFQVKPKRVPFFKKDIPEAAADDACSTWSSYQLEKPAPESVPAIRFRRSGSSPSIILCGKFADGPRGFQRFQAWVPGVEAACVPR